MAILPPPDRGQPIDVPYIYQIVTRLNQLAEQIEESSDKYTTIYTRELADSQNLRTSDTKFFATYVDLPQQLQITTRGQKESFSVNMSGFKYPPIVTATTINTGTSDAGNDATASITSVTTSRVDGFVTFNSTGNVNVAVNIIAIGIPE
jgi:hypothetical protein